MVIKFLCNVFVQQKKNNDLFSRLSIHFYYTVLKAIEGQGSWTLLDTRIEVV